MQPDIAAQQEAAPQHAGHDERRGDQGEAGSKQDESDQCGANGNDELADTADERGQEVPHGVDLADDLRHGGS